MCSVGTKEKTMAFDIYSGTFVHFYTRDWENVAQSQARLNGTEYKIIYAEGDQGTDSKEDVQAAVDAWKNDINAALARHSLGPIEWSEADDQPYFTDRPFWQGYLAIQQWAAHLERPELPVSYFLSEDPANDAAMAKAMEDDKNIHFRSILQGGVWLPGDFDFLFKFPALTDGEIMIGSTGRLLKELNEIRSSPLKWCKKPLFSFGSKKGSISFQETAEWALPIFIRIVENGYSVKLPFVLSF